MKIVHCLFEQSGTFKKVFKEYGHKAYDYDILDDYGETDFKIDLFAEIEKEYLNITNGKTDKTIFTNMKPNKNFIIAFFPCTYFTDINEMIFTIRQNTKNEITKKNMEEVIKRSKDRQLFFEIYLKFCFICYTKGIPTIIENPIGMLKRNYLTLYSPFRPSFFEKNRSLFGDNMIKPTMFISINFEMKENFMMFDAFYGKKVNPTKQARGRKRSEITTRYAKNFYQRFMLNKI